MTLAPFQALAVNFASAMVKGDFDGAFEMLSPELKASTTGDELRNQFTGMYRGYTQGAPSKVSFDEEFSGVDWPAKQPGDIGWAYVGIEGEGFVEAVTVTVAQAGEHLCIRNVEWGRP